LLVQDESIVFLASVIASLGPAEREKPFWACLAK
jgi:hypothetical protein